jgi:hypothetical protein
MYRSQQHNRADQVTVRYAGSADDRALAELAALDSAPMPTGPVLVGRSGARSGAVAPAVPQGDRADSEHHDQRRPEEQGRDQAVVGEHHEHG